MAGQYSAHSALLLLPKLKDPDPDLRFMALSDLNSIITHGSPSLFQNEYSAATKIIEAIVISLQDQIGEVQNMAVKCIQPFVLKVNETILCALLDRIANIPMEDSAVDNAVPALALKTVVLNLEHPIQGSPRSKEQILSYNAISRVLIPKLTGNPPARAAAHEPKKQQIGLVQKDLQSGSDTNTIDVLTDIARFYGSMLHDSEVSGMIKISLDATRHPRASITMKKKAVFAISALFPYLSSRSTQEFISTINADASSGEESKSRQKLSFALLAALAKGNPSKFAPFIPTFIQHVKTALSQEQIEADDEKMQETEERDPEADETREYALMALESWLSFCPEAMEQYTKDVLDIINRFLKYDPNLAHFADMDEDDFEEEQLEGEDFEEDVGVNDEDDVSWKVRKCAAKAAHTLILVYNDEEFTDDNILYTDLAPQLITRFTEREEAVRLEVLSALGALIRLTGGNTSQPYNSTYSQLSNTHHEPPSRKRRRVGSDASMIDLLPDLTINSPALDTTLLSSKAFVALEKISPSIVKGLSDLIYQVSLPTKQVSISVLKDLVFSLHGRLIGYLDNTLPAILQAIEGKSSSTFASATAVQSYRVEALDCLSAIVQVQSFKELENHLSNIIDIIGLTLGNRTNQIALATLNTVEQIIYCLTPPKCSSTNNRTHLDNLTTALINIASAHETDLDVRQLSIQHLGLLLGRSSLAPSLLSPDTRVNGLNLLLQRLKNETTRLNSARAIEFASAYSRNASDFPKDWVDEVSKELIPQFRKASRSLRGASLAAMKILASNSSSRVHLSRGTVDEILESLLLIIQNVDFHTLTPALLILAALIEKDPKNENYSPFIQPIGNLVRVSMPKITWKAFLSAIRAFGSNGIGDPLMKHLLDSSLNSPADAAGKAIGTLLVSGQDHIEVQIKDFVKELSSGDEQRKCLAFGVLGETACLMGSSSSLTPNFFIDHFSAGSNDITSQAAASALGRAGSGNVSIYVPVILSTINASKKADQSHLILLAIREIVHADDLTELSPYVQELWNHVMEASQDAINRSVGAECIGRLVLMDPKGFLPQLEEFLSTSSTTNLRNLGLSALRVTVTSDSTNAQSDDINVALKPALAAVCKLVPNEDDLDNRKTGLTIVNAAIHTRFNKLILPSLDNFISLIIDETRIRPELIKEVVMGPFKHTVDDGIECRKAAHECIYALVSLTQLPATSLEKIILTINKGVEDDAEIKVIALLSLQKFIEIQEGAEVTDLLPVFLKVFKTIISAKPKETAVKQEIERMEQSSKAVIRVALDVQKRFNDGISPEWNDWWNSVRKDHGLLVDNVKQESSLRA